MESAPLNLSHFHERRADKFLLHHFFDDALKAIEMSMMYLQDAYKHVSILKAIELLDTQKWELERKLRQIEMRKKQYEQAVLQKIIPPKNETSSPLPSENSTITAQSLAKSIELTVRELNEKLSSTQDISALLEKEFAEEIQEQSSEIIKYLEPTLDERFRCRKIKSCEEDEGVLSSMTFESNENITVQSTSSVPATVDCEDLPSLAPLELPTFDFAFTSSAPSVLNFTGSFESLEWMNKN